MRTNFEETKLIVVVFVVVVVKREYRVNVGNIDHYMLLLIDPKIYYFIKACNGIRKQVKSREYFLDQLQYFTFLLRAETFLFELGDPKA